jgi:hypothetical protein
MWQCHAHQPNEITVNLLNKNVVCSISRYTNYALRKQKEKTRTLGGPWLTL